MKRFLLLALVFLSSGVALGVSRTKTDEVTASDGGPVSFPAGFTMPTANGEVISSATYAATLTAGANVAAVVTPVTLKYNRFGNYVHVFGQVSIDPTAGSATLTTFVLSAPIVRSANFSGTLGAAGAAGLPASIANGVCSATNSAKTISCTYGSGGTAVELVNVDFWYTLSGD